MEQRGVTEVDLRAMLERATRYEPSVVEGRLMIHAIHKNRPWIVIVEIYGFAPCALRLFCM